MTKGKSLFGIVLVVLGVIFLLDSSGVVNLGIDIENLNLMTYSWPFFLLVPAILFHAGFFLSGMKKSNAGLLVPGGILLTLSLLFFFETFTGWRFSGVTWPIYILAPAVGLFELYIFGGREKGLLIPVGILSSIGVFFLLQNIFIEMMEFWPIILVLGGLFLLLGRNKEEKISK
ncbi:hypothetical protein EJF36_07610 [Bacillus sp. HMF5848]|uniref:hypothetical protein n=1 Tax=Bacillus sp. HMF5848 TaxID=2495421 RepID=UPI000F7AF055|nr:hypothetical protein [Bacillus sp. HMF5848]RSK26738.1 hypothetical protein EJF36_07610 [Bacillus sp. HMF5848]